MVKTSKHRSAEELLPPELRDGFNVLVEDYREACRAHVSGGKEFVNYNILADLIRAGWRKVPQPEKGVA